MPFSLRPPYTNMRGSQCYLSAIMRNLSNPKRHF